MIEQGHVDDLRFRLRVLEQADRIERYTGRDLPPGTTPETVAQIYQLTLAPLDEIARRTPDPVAASRPDPAAARDALARRLTGYGLCSDAVTAARCIDPATFRSRDPGDPASVGVLRTGDSALPSYRDAGGQLRTRAACDDSVGYQVACVGPDGALRVGPAGAEVVVGADGNAYAVPQHVGTARARIDAIPPEDCQQAAEQLHHADPASVAVPRYPVTGPPPPEHPPGATQLQNPVEALVDRTLDAAADLPVLGDAVRALREWTGW